MNERHSKVAVIAHVHELQRRMAWVVLFIVLGGIAAYMVYPTLLHIIQMPLQKTLYYTSPAGGFSFIFKLCATIGLITATPLAFYHTVAFLRPVMPRVNPGVILLYALWSFNLALAGLMFAYFFSLPGALNFLSKFGGDSIQALITAEEYFNFALAYLGGFALLFQLPLIVLVINRIKPLKAGRMMSAQRYIILGSFIAAAIITPTPDPINQGLMALPVIFLYQASIILVIITNKKARRKARRI